MSGDLCRIRFVVEFVLKLMSGDLCRVRFVMVSNYFGSWTNWSTLTKLIFGGGLCNDLPYLRYATVNSCFLSPRKNMWIPYQLQDLNHSKTDLALNHALKIVKNMHICWFVIPIFNTFKQTNFLDFTNNLTFICMILMPYI